MTLSDRLSLEMFPRASKYNPAWLKASVSGGANPLWLAEWLAPALNLRPGMRILDLGCGRAVSSIFLHREFGVQVWATDLWFSASENFQRIKDAGAEGGVFPIHAEARELPFAAGFFDAIVSIDSFVYYGTDDLYLNYLAGFLQPGGLLGIAGAGLLQEIEGEVPEHLRAWWTPEHWCLHSAPWWKRHWARTKMVEVTLADSMPDGWQRWLDWHYSVCPDNAPEIQALEADQGRYLGYVRAVAKRLPGVKLEERLVSIPSEYRKEPLFRTE